MNAACIDIPWVGFHISALGHIRTSDTMPRRQADDFQKIFPAAGDFAWQMKGIHAIEVVMKKRNIGKYNKAACSLAKKEWNLKCFEIWRNNEKQTFLSSDCNQKPFQESLSAAKH